MRRTAAAVILIISLLITGLAVAGPFEDATKAYNRGDYKTAYSLFKSLAEQGDANAQYKFGILYQKGRGVPQNDAEAVKWYRRAAEQGLPEAQNKLGVSYSVGKVVPQDYVVATMWFNLAVHRFPASEIEKRKEAEKNRNMIASTMTPDQIAEAQRMAREWKPKMER